MQDIDDVLLRKHCKEGAYVATQFLTHVLIKKLKKIKIAKNNKNPKKIHFWYICIVFSIFNVVSKEFKFSKVFQTHLTFHTSFLKSVIFLIESTLILLVFEKQNTKNKENQN